MPLPKNEIEDGLFDEAYRQSSQVALQAVV
jgi:hypothetical protein